MNDYARFKRIERERAMDYEEKHFKPLNRKEQGFLNIRMEVVSCVMIFLISVAFWGAWAWMVTK